MAKDVSIIIPTLNESLYLPGLLDSISTQCYDGKFEVIVVDAKSIDGTIAIAKKYKKVIKQMKCVVSDRQDIGYQRNIGVKASSYEVILFLDADVVLDKYFLDQAVQKIGVHETYVLAFMHRFRGMSLTDRLFFVIGCTVLIFLLIIKMPVTNGDCMLTNKKTFNLLGGFKQGVFLGEDIDFGRRAIAISAYYKFHWRPRVVGSLRRAYKMGRSKLLLSWVPLYFRVIKNGPILKKDAPKGYHYGDY